MVTKEQLETFIQGVRSSLDTESEALDVALSDLKDEVRNLEMYARTPERIEVALDFADHVEGTNRKVMARLIRIKELQDCDAMLDDLLHGITPSE